jgi:hypothetical protein
MEHFEAEGAQLQNKSNVIPFVPPIRSVECWDADEDEYEYEYE